MSITKWPCDLKGENTPSLFNKTQSEIFINESTDIKDIRVCLSYRSFRLLSCADELEKWNNLLICITSEPINMEGVSSFKRKDVTV